MCSQLEEWSCDWSRETETSPRLGFKRLSQTNKWTGIVSQLEIQKCVSVIFECIGNALLSLMIERLTKV